MRIVKQDAASGARLSGAVFQLWRESNGVPGLQTGGTTPDSRQGQQCTTDTTGTCRRTAPVGSAFYWQETEAPAGYDSPSPAVFGPVVLSEALRLQGVTTVARNKKTVVPEVTGKLQVRKVDARTGQGLARAVVELWRESGRRPGLQTSGPDRDRQIGSGCATDAQGR
ncbi:hypothetical protein GCM10018773_26740 [Streptomyces candidus]|nr:hypothetical protein GCM10018773_26740 [Streptomyces candidus]